MSRVSAFAFAALAAMACAGSDRAEVGVGKDGDGLRLGFILTPRDAVMVEVR